METSVLPLERPGFILRMALCIGVATGLGEVALFAAQTRILHRFIFVGRDLVWMAPLAELVVFTGVGLLLVGLGRILKRPMWVPAAWAMGFLSLLALLLMYTPLHKGAAIVLALGLTYQFVRLARKYPAGFVHLIHRGGWALLAVLVVLGGAFRGARWWKERQSIAARPAARPGVPNILLIILDTVRASELSAYGYERPTTPVLKEFARTSVRFDWAFSNAPWTLPSHATLFTGRFPHELSAGWLSPLDARFPTLAETLGAAGYRTAGFVGNLLYTDTEKGLDRGFERWEDYPVTPGEMFRNSVLIRVLSGRRWFRDLIDDYDLLGRKSAGEVSRGFLAWLDRGVQERPFFTFLNYFDAHAPYVPDPVTARMFATPGLDYSSSEWARFRGTPDTLPPDWVQDNRDRYDALVHQLDAELGRLFAELARRGILDNTVVIVTSDHGEHFGEHGIMGHANSLYLPLLHVPLFIRYPKSVPQGTIVTRPVSLRDVAATITDLAGVAGASALPGRSLARFWRSDTTFASQPDTLLMEVNYEPRLAKGGPIDRGSMRAVILDTLHYILNGDRKEELYRLIQDPGEKSDLSGQPEAAADLARHRAAIRSPLPPAPRP